MFGRIPKAVESVGEVKDGAKLMVQRVDNILEGEEKIIDQHKSFSRMSNQ